MDEEVINDLYNRARSKGYKKSLDEFISLLHSDQEVFDDMYGYVQSKGYKKGTEDFSALIGKTQSTQQQPVVQPTVQPTVKKKDDMEWDWFGGDGSSELEPSKTERPTTVAEASQTWKKAEAPKPMFVPDYTKPIEEEKFTLTRPTELGFVGRVTPEQLKEQTPRFIEENLESLTPKQLASYGAKGTKELLDYYFKDAGFKIDADREYVNVVSPDGQTYQVNTLLPSKTQLDELKNFVRLSAYNNPQIADKAYLYEKENKKFKTKEEIDNEVKNVNAQEEQFMGDYKKFLNLKKDIDDIEADLKRWRDFGEQNTSKYIQTEAYLNERKKELEQYSGVIKEKAIDLKAQGEQLNKAVGKYTEFQATQGDFGGTLYRAVAETSAGIFSQYLRLATSKTIDMLPISALMSEENYQSEIDKKLKERGYKDEKTVPIDVLNSIKSEIKDDFKKAAITGEYQGEKLNNVLTINGVRESLSELLTAPITSTSEYKQKREKEGGFIERGMIGLAGSLPAMVGGKYLRYMNMFMMTTDAAMKEMDNNPNFANISENEKELVALPIGVVGAALEEIGLKNLKLGKSVTSGIIKAVIGRVPANATASTVRKATFDVVAEMGIKAGTAYAGGILSEMETGAAQQMNEYLIKDIYSTMKGKKMFDNPAFLSGQYLYDVWDASRTEGVGAGVMSVPYSIAAAFQKDGFQALDDATFKIFEDLAKDNDSRKFFVTSLKNKINLGEVTPNQGKQMLDAYDQALGMIGMVPDEITDPESRKIAMDLLSERKKLETKKQGKDDALAKPIQNKIDQINEQLTKLTEDAIQKQAASQVSVQPETEAGQEVEVGGTEAKPKITPEESKRKENLIAALEATDKDIITIGDEMLDRKEAQAELEAITQKEQAAVTEQGGMEQPEGLGTQLETVAKEEQAATEKTTTSIITSAPIEIKGGVVVTDSDGNDVVVNGNEQVVAKLYDEAIAVPEDQRTPNQNDIVEKVQRIISQAAAETTTAEVTPVEQFTEQDRARKAELEEAMRKADKRRKNITVGETTMSKTEAKAELDALVQKEQATVEEIVPVKNPAFEKNPKLADDVYNTFEDSEVEYYDEIPIEKGKYYRVTGMSEINSILDNKKLQNPERSFYDRQILTAIAKNSNYTMEQLEDINSNNTQEIRNLYKKYVQDPAKERGEVILNPRAKSSHGDIGFQKEGWFSSYNPNKKDSSFFGAPVIVGSESKSKFLQGHHGSYSGRTNEEIKENEPVVLREGFDSENFEYWLYKDGKGWYKQSFNNPLKQQAQNSYSEYLSTTKTPTIEGFKEFIKSKKPTETRTPEQEADLLEELLTGKKKVTPEEPKFQKGEQTKPTEEIESVIDEMNSMPEDVANFDVPSDLSTKKKTNITSLIKRFGDKLKSAFKGGIIKNISDYNGIPMIFTISDQLSSGKIKNEFTGNTIDINGGIGFNLTDGNENNAWANTTEEESVKMLNRAKEVYSKNKDLFDRLWAEGKLPKGQIPMAIVKMGQESIQTNEALFRFAADTIRKKFSKTERKNSLNGLIEDISAIDPKSKVISFIKDNNFRTIDELLDNMNKLKPIGERGTVTRFLFTGGLELNKETKPGKPRSKSGLALVGDKDASYYKYIHLQTINNAIQEDSTKEIPSSHIIGITGVDVLNPEITNPKHKNYPYGVKGGLIGILESPVHAADIFPEMYSKTFYLQKQNISGKSTSPKVAAEQAVAPSGFVATIKAFRGAKISTKMTELQKLLGKLKLAFPSVTIVETQQEFDKALENPEVKKFVKDGEVVYGFTKDGKIFLNPKKANSNTAIHEFSHIWMNFLKENNPKLLEKGYSLLEGTEVLKSKIAEFGNTELAREEAMAELIANKGETLIEAGKKSKFKNWLNAVYSYVKSKFKSFEKLTPNQFQNISLNDFIDGSLASLLSGREITSKEIKSIEVLFSKEKAKNNTEIIKIARANGISEAGIRAYFKKNGLSDIEIDTLFDEEKGAGKKIILTEETLPGYTKLMNRINDIIARGRRNGKTDDDIMKGVIANIESRSPEYANATDQQREQIIRDIRKLFGKKEKAAPSAEKITGKPKPKKVTVNDMTALKKQIELEIKAAREGAKSVSDAVKAIVEYFNSIKDRGNLTRKDIIKILGIISKVNSQKTLDNAANKIFEIIEKAKSDVIEVSEYKALVDQIKLEAKAAKEGKKQVRDAVKEIVRLFNKSKVITALTRADLKKIINLMDKVYDDTSLQKAVGEMFDIILKSNPDLIEVSKTKLAEEFKRKVNAGIRQGKKDLNTKRKELTAAIKDMKKKGSISVRQAKVLINRINAVNLDNPVMVERMLDYAEKVFNDADYDTRIQEVRKLQDKVKKVNHVSMRDTVREFASINPERIPADRLLDYIQALDDMSTRTPFYQKMNDMFDEVMSYKSESKEFDAIKTFQALIDKLESIAINQVKSVEDYVALIRDINSFKRKAYQLLQNGAITQEQYDKAIENVGKDQAAVEKKYEKELAALKEKLVQEINGLKPEVHPDFTPEEAALINKYLELSESDLESLSPEDLYILNDLLNNIKEDAQLDYYRLSEIVSKAYTNAGGQKLAEQLNESKFNKSSDEGKKLLLEQESAFWEGLLGLGRAVSGALQKFIVSPFNRAIASYENAMKDGYYEFSKLKRKYNMKDYNMHRLGIFTTYLQEYMAQFDPANKDVKDIGTRDWFGEIISNSSMRDGYRSAKPSALRLIGMGDTELKIIEKIYKSLPKDANGKVDPKAVYDSFMANDGKFFTKKEKAFFDKVMDWKQKNLTTKQKAANEMNGMPFKEIPFHMMRVRLDRGAKQISPTAEGGSGVIRIEAGTGKERASQKVGPIMTNFEQLFSENLEQTARNYYLQEAINDINNTLSVAKKNLKENKERLFNTIPKTISDALNFEFDKTESQFLARNLLAARAAETLFNVIRTSVELTSTFLSYPFRAKTPQGYKELFGKQGQMKKLLDFTSSPLRLRENINKAIDISDGRIKPKGKFEKAINYLSGLPERTMMVTSWMPTFNNEFKDITGVRFDMDKFKSDAEYRQKYGKAIKEAAAVADAQTEKIIGSTTKAGGRREIRIAPKILANIFGAEGTIKKNTTAGQILGFFSNYPYREVTEFLNGFREAAEVYKQGGGALKSISQLQKPLGVTINLATYGFLSSVVYAMKLMLLGDDEDEEKGEAALKELVTLKGFMEELQGNAISLAASKYAAGGKAILQLGATVAYNSTSDEEQKAKIKKLLKNSVFIEPIDAAKVQGYGGINEVLGAISSYVPQFVLFAKRIEETIQTAGELKVMYKKFQDGGIDALSEDEGLAILAIDGLFKSAQAVLNLRGTSLPMYNDIKMYMKGIKKEAGVGDIKLSGTENQHKKALQGYKNEKEFKENDPNGYLEAIDEGGSIYKYKEEQSKKEEEKNKDKPFRGMSEEAFKKKYREEYIENYGPGTEYYEEQRTPEAIEKRAEMRALQKEENAIKAKNKKKRNEEDTEE